MKHIFHFLFVVTLISSCGSEQDQLPAVGNAESELRDIWILQEMYGFVVDTATFPNEFPRLELNPLDSSMMGTTGCNNINSTLIALEDRSIQFGPIASTRKYCIDVPEAQFLDYVTQTKRYSREGLQLMFFNDSIMILKFKKVD